MQTIKVYLDLPLVSGLISWIQDATLLWMVGQITSYKPSLKRLVMGGAAGGIFQFLLMINQITSGVVFRWVLSPIVFTMFVPGLMLGITFHPMTFRKALRVFGYFYLISFLLAGIEWGIDSINRRFWQIEITIGWRFWLHLLFTLILGELGWGIIHQKVWEKVCLYSVKVRWDHYQVNFTALLDTGNKLCDPLTRAPVALVEIQVFQSYLPPELLTLINNLQTAGVETSWNLPDEWSERLRLLPFRSVGNVGGMLVGFRPDELVIWRKNKALISKGLIVAFYQQKLSPEGFYQGLIPPAVLGV